MNTNTNGETKQLTPRIRLEQACKAGLAALENQQAADDGFTVHDKAIAEMKAALKKAESAPVPLSAELESAVKLWAADDRLWTTQETVEFNLRVFARAVLNL